MHQKSASKKVAFPEGGEGGISKCRESPVLSCWNTTITQWKYKNHCCTIAFAFWALYRRDILQSIAFSTQKSKFWSDIESINADTLASSGVQWLQTNQPRRKKSSKKEETLVVSLNASRKRYTSGKKKTQHLYILTMQKKKHNWLKGVLIVQRTLYEIKRDAPPFYQIRFILDKKRLTG